jgi:hypothetical protein
LKSLFTILFILFLSASGSTQSFSDFSKKDVYSDIEFLFSHLQEIHPNSSEVDSSKVEIIKSGLKSEYYSESDAFFIFNGFLKLLNDGHSNVKFSSERTKEIIQYGEFFPYQLQFFDSTAVVTGTIGLRYEEVQRREIFKINNIPIKSILEDLAIVSMVDGEHNTSSSEWLSDDFWFYFTLYNGFRSSYSITYLENGREFHEIAKALNRNEFLKTSFLEDFNTGPFDLSCMNGITVLSVSNFNQKSPLWWKIKLKSIFKELDKQDVSELVLDLRDNGGGQENLQNILLESFGVSTSDKYELEVIKKIDFRTVSGIQNERKEKLKSMGLENFVFREDYGDDFKGRKGTHYKSAKQRYSGELFILIDGTTFSCASDAAAILKENYPRTKLIGTETRGSGKVNYAGYFVHVELPKTGFVIRVPRVKYILNNKLCSEYSGIIPDIHVAMDKSDVQKDVDSQLTFLFNYLKEKESALEEN